LARTRGGVSKITRQSSRPPYWRMLFSTSSNRGDVVIDPFLGSGSTLIAADKTGRVCRGVELDPLYVDVIVRRYEADSGQEAVLVDTGETFKELEALRAVEAAPV